VSWPNYPLERAPPQPHEYPLDRLVGPHGWSECFGDLLTVPGVESQFLGYPTLGLAALPADALLFLVYCCTDTLRV
jgi:hypothetical protein